MIHSLLLAISSGALGLASLAEPSSQDGQAYFPPALHEATMRCALAGRGAQREVMSDFKAEWYGRHLRAAGEAPLFEASGPTLRFTWLRSFDPPVVIRLDVAADWAVTMTATELSGRGGYEPGTVARRIERRLSAEETLDLMEMLDETEVLEQAPGTCDLGRDGAQWIVEFVAPEGYQFADRWSPDDGPVREFGLHLIGLTGWTYESIY